MGQRVFNILIIEDHPFVWEAYNVLFKSLGDQNPHWTFHTQYGNSGDRAVFILKNQRPDFDLVLLDLNMPPSSNGKFLSGEDIAGYIRGNFPKTKILINSSGGNPAIRSVLKNINPEGLVIKAETTVEILMRAVIEILLGGSYYGKSVLQLMKLPFGTDLILDEWDRKLLYELDRGTLTTHIPEILPLSLSSVARRKKRLKEIFEVEGLMDRELLEKARRMGFI